MPRQLHPPLPLSPHPYPVDIIPVRYDTVQRRKSENLQVPKGTPSLPQSILLPRKGATEGEENKSEQTSKQANKKEKRKEKKKARLLHYYIPQPSKCHTVLHFNRFESPSRRGCCPEWSLVVRRREGELCGIVLFNAYVPYSTGM